MYSNRNSLSLTVLFSEIKGNCAKYLADATFKILSNPPIEGLIRRNAVFQESSSVECIGVITTNRIIPPCESTIPLEVDPNFVGYNGYNQFDQLLRLNISMLAKVADNLKIDVMMEDLTAKAIGENLVIEWDDYSRCSTSAHPSVNLRIVPDNLDSIKEHYEISVPASCFKHSNNSMHNVLFISGYSRVECPNDITKEYNINLLPCTTYNLSLSIDGIIRKRSKEVQFTTFLNEKGKSTLTMM